MKNSQKTTVSRKNGASAKPIKQFLPELRCFMYKPKQKRKVMIVDDSQEKVMGMELILDAWSNLALQVIIVDISEGDDPHIGGQPETVFEYQDDCDGVNEVICQKILLEKPDILLLDHSIGIHVSGDSIFNRLVELDFGGLCISTTGGSQPSYIVEEKYHFGQYITSKKWLLDGKNLAFSVESNLVAAKRFVNFMNQRFYELEQP